MNYTIESITHLEFSQKYDADHSQAYFEKHKSGLRHKLTTLRETSIARQSLRMAGNPKSVLDLPCGAGRFWNMLAECDDRVLFAADYSDNMIKTAKKYQPAEVVDRFNTFQTSAFNIKMDNHSVDNIFCMRLLHHIAKPEDRLSILKEFHRVARKSVCLTMWTDGNIQAKNRAKLENRRGPEHFQNRIVVPRELAESEYQKAGFNITGYIDLLPKISMWRLYVLEKS